MQLKKRGPSQNYHFGLAVILLGCFWALPCHAVQAAMGAFEFVIPSHGKLTPHNGGAVDMSMSCRRALNPDPVSMVIQFGDIGLVKPGQFQFEAKVDNEFWDGAGVSVDFMSPTEAHERMLEAFLLVMEQWANIYTQEQQIFMQKLHEQLSPERTYFLTYKFDGLGISERHKGLSGLRLFDGSQPFRRVSGFRVKSSDETEDPSRLQEALTPIELSPKNRDRNYLLPWRSSGQVKPVQIMHFGLVTNVRGFKSGVQVMLSYAADHLDADYNGQHMKIFGDTDRIEDRPMHVIASVKHDLLDYYLGMGFHLYDAQTGEKLEDVITVNSNGEAQNSGPDIDRARMPDGMYLFGLTGAEFLTKFHGGPQVADIEIQEGDFTFGTHTPTGGPQEGWRMARIHANRNIKKSVRPISSRSEFSARLEKFAQMEQSLVIKVQVFLNKHPEVLEAEQNDVTKMLNNEEYVKLHHAFRKYVSEGYLLVQGIPKDKRQKNWQLWETETTGRLVDSVVSSLIEIMQARSFLAPELQSVLRSY